MELKDYKIIIGIETKEDERIESLKNSLKTIIKYSELFESIDNHKNNNIYYSFCLEIGKEYSEYYSGLDEVANIICDDKNGLREILYYYQALINVISNNEDKKMAREIFEEYMEKFNIGYQETTYKSEIIILPSGDKIMDEALVSDVLSWLNEYPKTKIAWEKSLKEFSKNDKTRTSEIADLFRKALETFFKEFFNTNSSLENCKKTYGQYLKDNGISSNISNNLESLLTMYYNFNNDCAKHNDKTNHVLLEYLLYQTGNTIRLLLNILKDSNYE